MFDPKPHIDWILADGRMLDLQGLTDALGARMRADGFPIMRLRLGLRTTHPLMAALSVFWEADSAPLQELATPHGLETSAEYIGSPMERIATSRRPFRQRLTDLGPEQHVTLHNLAARGATDYYGLPMTFSTGGKGIVIYASDGTDGFSDTDLAALQSITAVLTPVMDTYGQQLLARAIATSYLGSRTGQRVLDGQITRGDIQSIEAAILFSDIRGWTALNTSRPASETLDIANRYFEVISDAVDNNDGEILKFMGDGVLALFPSDGTEAGRQHACRQAIAAAHAAHGIAALADLPISFGIGIHYGSVLYGNVGARERIDFTILGQAVNTAARVEACCGRLSEKILVSQVVADQTGGHMRHVATEVLKGLDAPMGLFAPANS